MAYVDVAFLITTSHTVLEDIVLTELHKCSIKYYKCYNDSRHLPSFAFYITKQAASAHLDEHETGLVLPF